MINSFSGEYRFLSNFYPIIHGSEEFRVTPVIRDSTNSIEYNKTFFETVEAAYQAAKRPELCSVFAQLSPKDAKLLGRHVNMSPGFEFIKLELMEDLVRQKFTKSEYLKQKLLDTGTQELVEGNNWGDRFWGVDGVGENHLGKILMKVRGELRDSK